MKGPLKKHGSPDVRSLGAGPSTYPTPEPEESDPLDWGLHEAPSLFGEDADGLDTFQVELELQNRELIELHTALEVERNLYASLFEDLPLSALVLDRAGVIHYANRAAARLFRSRSVAALSRCSLYRFLDEDARTALHAALNRATSPSDLAASGDGTSTVRDIVLKETEGRPVILNGHLTRLPEIGGSRGLMQMVLVDRSDDVERERAHRQIEAFQRNADSMLHAFDLDGHLFMANDAVAAHLDEGAELTGEARRRLHPLLGSRAMDIEILVSGRPRISRSRYLDASGTESTYLLQKFPMRDARGEIFAVGGITMNATDLIETQATLDEALGRASALANRDPLTRLPNRQWFMDRLQEEISVRERRGGTLTLGFLDMDGFKDVNDSMGHEVGDALLCAFARRLEEAVGTDGFIARFGGDEFLLCLADETPENTDLRLSDIFDQIRTPYEVAATRIVLTCSVGLSQYPKDARAADDLLRAADMAVYSSKSLGRDRITHFKEELRVNSERRLRIVSALRRALCEDNFRLVYQPKFDLAGSGGIIGAEALLRWRDPTMGDIAPSEFVPLAEFNGLNVALDLHVFKMFAAQQRAWCALGLRLPISINVSARSLQSVDFVPTILSLLDYHDIDPDLLLLEVTETGLMQFSADAAAHHAQLAELGEAGVRLSIDDFGTGYSSLSYLQELNPREIKIDRSFIHRIGAGSDASERIVQGVLALAKSLNLQTVAEGIETEAQRVWLAENGCDIGQGFLMGTPLEPADFERLVRL